MIGAPGPPGPPGKPGPSGLSMSSIPIIDGSGSGEEDLVLGEGFLSTSGEKVSGIIIIININLFIYL